MANTPYTSDVERNAAQLTSARSPKQWIHDLGVQALLPKLHQAGLPRTITPQIVEAIVFVESGGLPHAVSQVGAQGIMQVMPATAVGLLQPNAHAHSFLKQTLGNERFNVLKGMDVDAISTSLQDPETSIIFGLATLVDKHGMFKVMGTSPKVLGDANPYDTDEKKQLFNSEAVSGNEVNLPYLLTAYSKSINIRGFDPNQVNWEYVGRIAVYLEQQGYRSDLDKLQLDATNLALAHELNLVMEERRNKVGTGNSSFAHNPLVAKPSIVTTTLPTITVKPPPMPKACEQLMGHLPEFDRAAFQDWVRLDSMDSSQALMFEGSPPSHGFITRKVADVCVDGLAKIEAGASVSLDATPAHGLVENTPPVKPGSKATPNL